MALVLDVVRWIAMACWVMAIVTGAIRLFEAVWPR